jgi:hypothetical protein
MCAQHGVCRGRVPSGLARPGDDGHWRLVLDLRSAGRAVRSKYGAVHRGRGEWHRELGGVGLPDLAHPVGDLWYKLTPDINGSYWSQIASTVAGYAPRFFASGVLPDGRLIIEGGEYYDAGCFGPPQIPDATQGSGTTQGAIYDPVANT